MSSYASDVLDTHGVVGNVIKSKSKSNLKLAYFG